MFLFRRRHHRPSLCKLLLILLGFGTLARRCRGGNTTCEHSQEDLAAHKAKAKQFRSKLKEAFSVWSDDEEAQAQAPAATAETTATSTEEKI
ncbi:MAG: hypothetical protein K0R39_1162 [Symbiobacteriaceae bacterium]|jgi:hypothetical protein|nr:hypothetical protein [Symbiobacteriaceae bacterium]